MTSRSRRRAVRWQRGGISLSIAKRRRVTELIGYFDAGQAVSLADGASRTLELSSGFHRIDS